ncbi:hypothetical protein GWI33_009674 [Rhynchophorus ferrugineus]|uniref:Uncharacterized protein n=1 Tax=Rhynchophorus ferrugineus TaxID=354439 RepID=A0A834MAR0_RHYFE|nr:hypothetical protein GWI33_009674 [Rhynchophorus ferrugineus]
MTKARPNPAALQKINRRPRKRLIERPSKDATSTPITQRQFMSSVHRAGGDASPPRLDTRTSECLLIDLRFL